MKIQVDLPDYTRLTPSSFLPGRMCSYSSLDLSVNIRVFHCLKTTNVLKIIY